MSKLIVRDKSNDEVISEVIVEDLWTNGQPIDAMSTEVNIAKLQNQKAIECLKEVKELIYVDFSITKDSIVIKHIDNKIKELEEEN